MTLEATTCLPCKYTVDSRLSVWHQRRKKKKKHPADPLSRLDGLNRSAWTYLWLMFYIPASPLTPRPPNLKLHPPQTASSFKSQTIEDLTSGREPEGNSATFWQDGAAVFKPCSDTVRRGGGSSTPPPTTPPPSTGAGSPAARCQAAPTASMGKLGPGADPSVSPGGSEGAAWYVSPSKTNGQEVRPQKQQYLQNLYSERSSGGALELQRAKLEAAGGGSPS